MDPLVISTLIAQGLRVWADFADRAAKGTLTEADVQAMADHLDLDIEGLRSDIAAKRAAKPVATAAATPDRMKIPAPVPPGGAS